MLPLCSIPTSVTKQGSGQASPTVAAAQSNSSTISSQLTPTQQNHQYAHIDKAKIEHAYAKVRGASDRDNYDDPRTVALRDEVKQKEASSHYEAVLSSSTEPLVIGEAGPLYPPSLCATTSQNNNVMVMNRSTSVEIQASSAIAGHTPANEELPYMTPKINQSSSNSHAPMVVASSSQTSTHGLSQLGAGFIASPSMAPEIPAPTAAEQLPDVHFSGDSQDSSSRGYTSISVREPLAQLKASGANLSSLPPHMQTEGYYQTVSDDSADEMYACIYDRTTNASVPEQVPVAAPLVNAEAVIPQRSPSPVVELSDPPAPPSVDSLKHVLHSRNASAGSGSAVLSSPGSEKRHTIGSPLPPLPQGEAHMYDLAADVESSPQKTVPQSPGHVVERPTPRSIEDMYAKVHKKRGSDADQAPTNKTTYHHIIGVTGGIPSNRPDPGYESVKGGDYTSSDPGYETLAGARGESEPGYETLQGATKERTEVRRSSSDYDPKYETLAEAQHDPGYEAVAKPTDRCYETLSKVNVVESQYDTVSKENESEPGYETVSETNRNDYIPGYESVKRSGSSEGGYEVVSGSDNCSRPEPGYESLRYRPESECDSNYEQIKFSDSPYQTIAEHSSAASCPVYAEINKPDSSKQQPVYATVIKKSPIENLDLLSGKSEIDMDTSELAMKDEKLPNEITDTSIVHNVSFDTNKNDSEANKDDRIDKIYAPEPLILQQNISSEQQVHSYSNIVNIVEISPCDGRSLQEEATLLVSSAEEEAVHILNERNKAIHDLQTSLNNEVTVCTTEGDGEKEAMTHEAIAVDQSSRSIEDLRESPMVDDPDRKCTVVQPTTLPVISPIVFGGPLGGSDSFESKDLHKASIEVHLGSSPHSISVDNSSSGQDDISPEDEVSLPPMGFQNVSFDAVVSPAAENDAKVDHKNFSDVKEEILAVIEEKSIALPSKVESLVDVDVDFVPLASVEAVEAISTGIVSAVADVPLPPPVVDFDPIETEIPPPAVDFDSNDVEIPPPPIADDASSNKYSDQPLPPPMIDFTPVDSAFSLIEVNSDPLPPIEVYPDPLPPIKVDLGFNTLPSDIETSCIPGIEEVPVAVDEIINPPTSAEISVPPLEAESFILSSDMEEAPSSLPPPPPPIEEDYQDSQLPPPPPMSDVPECDLPPPLPRIPPPMVESPQIVFSASSPLPESVASFDYQEADEAANQTGSSVEHDNANSVEADVEGDITVRVNPMAEIDELASRVADVCAPTPKSPGEENGQTMHSK